MFGIYIALHSIVCCELTSSSSASCTLKQHEAIAMPHDTIIDISIVMTQIYSISSALCFSIHNKYVSAQHQRDGMRHAEIKTKMKNQTNKTMIYFLNL